MAQRKLKILTISPGVKAVDQMLNLDDSQKMDEVHIFFSRPLNSLEFEGLVATIERGLK